MAGRGRGQGLDAKGKLFENKGLKISGDVALARAARYGGMA